MEIEVWPVAIIAAAHLALGFGLFYAFIAQQMYDYAPPGAEPGKRYLQALLYGAGFPVMPLVIVAALALRRVFGKTPVQDKGFFINGKGFLPVLAALFILNSALAAFTITELFF